MSTYIILTNLDSDAVSGDFRQRAGKVTERIRKECPGVRWKDSYALLGRFDVIDIVEADDPTEVQRAATIIRAEGHGRTETIAAIPWKQFLAGL